MHTPCACSAQDARAHVTFSETVTAIYHTEL
jgi:hypothetical protein